MNDDFNSILSKANKRELENNKRVSNFIDRWNKEIKKIEDENQTSNSQRIYTLELFEIDKGRLYRYIGNDVYSNEDIQDCEIRLENSLNLKLINKNFVSQCFENIKEITFSLIKK
ncbi:MAG: hypothetical protein AWU59_2032 [Methanolobus sp. T82-4]|nr:MAG: hypothetical protein AWU59_2032 [Methanolobus sp. T82-4]